MQMMADCICHFLIRATVVIAHMHLHLKRWSSRQTGQALALQVTALRLLTLAATDDSALIGLPAFTLKTL